MINTRRTLLAVAAMTVAVGLSGCCVTSISCRKAACPAPCSSNQPVYAPVYQPVPQGLPPVDAPPLETPPPQPYVPPPPAPTSTKQSLGNKTAMALHSMSERIKDVFER